MFSPHYTVIYDNDQLDLGAYRDDYDFLSTSVGADITAVFAGQQ